MTDLNESELESLRQHWYRLGFEDGRKIGHEEWRDGNVYRGSDTPPECQHDFRPNTGTIAGSTCRKCGTWQMPWSPPSITSVESKTTPGGDA